MEQVRDQRVTQLVETCAGLSAEERRALLDRECSGDDRLRYEVESELRGPTDSEQTQVFQNDYEDSLPDHYRLIRMAGRGGMAEVFVAEDKRLARNVAIKFLNSEFRRNPERMRRFHQEARAASALNHPNIIVIHDIGERNGVQYIVSEYVEGDTLGTRIARGRLGIDDAVSIAIQIASALSSTHRAGIVHRDLKPENVMVRNDGAVKVLDFGLAKETGHIGHSDPDLNARTLDKVSTAAGLIMGTPQYMSPEQARGSQLDARTDIFSLGILIFEMLTGRPPFTGNSMADTIAAIVSKEPRRLEEFIDDPPLSLIRILQKSLRKDRDERYGTMEHLLSDLKDFQNELREERFFGRETGGTEARATLNKTVRTTANKFQWWKSLLLLPVIVFVIVAIWWFMKAPTGTNLPLSSQLNTIGITSWDSGPGDALGAASFSPNAEMVAFAATRSGSTEIWVKPAAGGESIQVTRSGFYNQYPLWSPDGREIAFFSSRGEDRGIWRTSFTGGQQLLITGVQNGSTRPVFWAKSGKVYFQEGPDLFSFTLNTKQRQQVTDFATQAAKPRMIEISADESMIAYSIWENDRWRIRSKPVDTEQFQELASSETQFDHIAWEPDGRSVVYSNSVNGTFQLFRAAIDGKPPVQLTNGNIDFFVQDISADGSKVLYGSVRETSDLWRVTVTDSVESLVANDVAAEYWADISPDGKRVAYQTVGQVDRPYSGSVVVRESTPSAPAITISDSGFSPRWSNDGKWVAYFKRGPDGIEIWRARPTGDEPLKLSKGSADAPSYMPTPYLKIGTNHFSWSPANDLIAYSATVDGISNIWAASVEGSSQIEVSDNTDPKRSYTNPVWTPGGKQVVFVAEFPSISDPKVSVFQLVIKDLESGEQKAVFETSDKFRFLGLGPNGENAIFSQRSDPKNTSLIPPAATVFTVDLRSGVRSVVNTLNNAYPHNIHLSPDGRSIAFVSRMSEVTAIWTIPLNSANPRKLLEVKDPKIMISSLAWSPDASFVDFGKQTRTSLLSMLAE